MKFNIQLFAVPARRVSKTRKNKRRASLKVSKPTFVKCPNCGEMITPHRACPSCGFYKGKEVIKQEKEASKEKKEVKETKTKKSEK